MNILEYINENYRLKSIDDIIYTGNGCSWGSDLDGKRFDKISESSLRYSGRGCNWFMFDGIRFDCVNIGDVNSSPPNREVKSGESNADFYYRTNYMNI